MKKIVLTGILLLSIRLTIAQQPYMPVPTENVIWRGSSWVDDGTGNGSLQGWYHYKAGKDTLIDSNVYTSIVAFRNPGIYYGAYYEDSSKKVYWRPRDSTQSFLLYDFGVEIGDTLLNLYPALTDTFVVHDIDTNAYNFPQYPGLGRRTIILSRDGDTFIHSNEWMEGVGCTEGFLEPSYIPLFESNVNLDCFQLDSVAYIFTACGPIGMEELGNRQEMDLYPNPMREQPSIAFENVPRGLIQLQLFDLTGRLVYKTQHEGSTTLIIPNHGFKPGMYLLNIIFSNRTFQTKKVIVK